MCPPRARTKSVRAQPQSVKTHVQRLLVAMFRSGRAPSSQGGRVGAWCGPPPGSSTDEHVCRGFRPNAAVGVQLHERHSPEIAATAALLHAIGPRQANGGAGGADRRAGAVVIRLTLAPDPYLEALVGDQRWAGPILRQR